MPASNAHDSHAQNWRKTCAQLVARTRPDHLPLPDKAGRPVQALQGLPSQTAGQAFSPQGQAKRPRPGKRPEGRSLPGQTCGGLNLAGLDFGGHDWLLPILSGNRRICANCRHWDLHYKACLPRLEHGQLRFDIAAPCAVGAVTTNAGDCVPMLGETGSCVGHADLFAPSDDYLNEMQEESERMFC